MTVKEAKKELNMIAKLVVYNVIAEKSHYNKNGLELMHKTLEKRFENNIKEVSKYLKNNTNQYNDHFHEIYKSVKIERGKKDYKPEALNMDKFFENIAKGFLLTKDKNSINIKEDLEDILNYGLNLLSKNYPTNIRLKEIKSENFIKNIIENSLNEFNEMIKLKKEKESLKLKGEVKGFKLKYKNIIDMYERVKNQLKPVVDIAVKIYKKYKP